MDGVARIVRLRVEETRQWLPQVSAVEPDDAARTGNPRQHRRLEQPLQINRRVVPLSTKPARRANEWAPALSRIARDDIADPIDALHQIEIAGIDNPIHAGFGMSV